MVNEEPVETKLQRIATKAHNDPKCRFTSLFHLMNLELLWECFWQLKDNKASGIDRITKEQYAENLMPSMSQDFIDDSYGFRPNRSCHHALRARGQTIERSGMHYIVEADIKGFFDNVDQDQLMEFLAHRIADKRVLRYIKRFLKAGIQEDGAYRASDRGSPQGGVLSPLLANLYLHYTLDLWFQRRFHPSCTGMARLIRYADDYVACFNQEADALCFRVEMEQRLILFEWLGRRGKRGSMNYAKFDLLKQRFLLPGPRIMVNLWSLQREVCC